MKRRFFYFFPSYSMKVTLNGAQFSAEFPTEIDMIYDIQFPSDISPAKLLLQTQNLNLVWGGISPSYFGLGYKNPRLQRFPVFLWLALSLPRHGNG